MTPTIRPEEDRDTTHEFKLTYRVTVDLPGHEDEEVAEDAAKKLVRDDLATLVEIE